MNPVVQTYAHDKNEKAEDATKIMNIHEALSRSTLSEKSEFTRHPRAQQQIAIERRYRFD